MATVESRPIVAEPRLETWTYPLAESVGNDMVALLRTEWTRTDFNWLEAMQGDYADELAMTSVIARLRGRAVATATVMHGRANPEVAILANVLTHPDFRARGIGGRVVDAAVALAQRVGCKLCLLGSRTREGNIYLRHGFSWRSGVVMGRQLAGGESFEPEYFLAGQSPTVRAVTWGDLPAVTLLAVQRLQLHVLDFCRGIVSGCCDESDRCASVFPLLMDDLQTHGGTMGVLTEPRTNRVFGFGTATLGAGPARRHTATIDVATHDNYCREAPLLIKELLRYCTSQQVTTVYAHVADIDEIKQAIFLDAGFDAVGKSVSALRINGELHDALHLEQTLNAVGENDDREDSNGLLIDHQPRSNLRRDPAHRPVFKSKW